MCASCDPEDCLSPVCFCRDPGGCLSPVLVWSLPLLFSKDFRSRMVSDGFQTQRRVRGSRVKDVQKKSLASAVSIDARSRMCGQGGVAVIMTSQQVCEGGTKYRQAIASRNGEWSTGSSTSSGEEERMNKSVEAENKVLRARLEALKKKEGEGVQGGQGLPSRRKSGLEEERDAEMDFEDEAESRKKLDEQIKNLPKELRDIEKL